MEIIWAFNLCENEVSPEETGYDNSCVYFSLEKKLTIYI